MVARVDPERFFKLRRARKERDVAALIEGLDDPIEGPHAAKYLRQVRAIEAVPLLRKHVTSPNPHLRSEVLTSLGEFGVVDAVPEVRFAAAHDSVAWVRAAAIEAGERLVPLDELRPLLYAGLKDEGWNARFVSAQVLGRHGDESDLSDLEAAKRADLWWRRSPYRKAKRAIRRRSFRRRLRG